MEKSPNESSKIELPEFPEFTEAPSEHDYSGMTVEQALEFFDSLPKPSHDATPEKMSPEIERFVLD